MTVFLELAERCEQATGPMFTLDESIALAVGWARDLVCQPYTASLDAAMTLVPEDLAVIQRSGRKWPVKARDEATLYDGMALAGEGHAATPALALCAAALRARAASADTRPEGGDSTKIEAPFTGGAVDAEGSETPNMNRYRP